MPEVPGIKGARLAIPSAEVLTLCVILLSRREYGRPAAARMLPYYAAPEENLQSEAGFSKDIMRTLIRTYAEKGSFGTDTYWGGKGLVQMALNMTFARQCGDEELYQKSRYALRSAFEDWLTYTPGFRSIRPDPNLEESYNRRYIIPFRI